MRNTTTLLQLLLTRIGGRGPATFLPDREHLLERSLRGLLDDGTITPPEFRALQGYLRDHLPCERPRYSKDLDIEWLGLQISMLQHERT